ncbi:MAG: nuclear transport factor 2 family protein [Gammaproteobacteria bacterium]|nr:nuclear transport factor 2 family protein [Gammaproteobacteria bacterium]
MSVENINVVRDMYDAFGRGDIAAVVASMDPDIEWNEAENFPYADRNPYIGPQAVVDGVFNRLAGEWEYWSLDHEEFFDAGDYVIVTGRYHAEHKGTGGEIRAQFAHVWQLHDGKVIRFQQYTDTAQIASAIAT